MYQLKNGDVPSELKVNPNLKQAPMVVLSPDSVPEDAQTCRELGTQGYLLRPQPAAGEDSSALHASGTAASVSLAVLVAEDNPLNQQLVSALLSGWGHRVDVANNGIEALDLHEKKRFDLILMDLQMPEMGGIEATARILERESGNANKTLIVAMTASIVEGERESCTAAGMADYLAKPFKVEMIAALLKKHFSSAAASFPAVAKPPSRPMADGCSAAEMYAEGGKFDYAAAIADADSEIVRLIAAMFLEQAPLHLRKIRWAWETGDLAVLQRQAHALTGLLGSFMAEPARCIAAEINRSARENKPLASAALFDALEREIADLSPHLAAAAKAAAGA